MKQEFKTKSLGLAVHLELCGLKLERIERKDSTEKATFIFSDPVDTAKKLVQDFWNEVPEFSVNRVLSTLAKIKNRLYELPTN